MERLPGRERRSAILSAARHVLATRGFLGTRAQDVARAAGISEGLIYKYFRSLGKLQHAVLEHDRNRSAVLSLESLAGERPARALETIVTAFLGAADRDPDFLRLLLFAALAGVPDAATLLRRESLKAERKIARVLRSWKARGWGPRDADTGGAARVIASALLFEAIARNLSGRRRSPHSPKRLLEGLAAFLGVVGSGGRSPLRSGPMSAWNTFRAAQGPRPRPALRVKRRRLAAAWE